jgi:hypothetical protein
MRQNVLKPTSKIFYSIFYLTISSMYLVSFFRWLALRTENSEVITWATDSPFAQAGPRFSDFFQVIRAATFDQPYFYGANGYPSSSLLILKPFTYLNDFSVFILLFSLSVWTLVTIFSVGLPKYSIATLAPMMMFPLHFGIDRGNLDVVVVALLFLGLFLSPNYWISTSILIGLAASLKLWPLLFVILFFRKRNGIKIVCLTSLVFLTLTILGLRIFGGTFLSALNMGGVSDGAGFISHNISARNAFSLIAIKIFGEDFETYLTVSKSSEMNILIVSLTLLLFLMFLSTRFNHVKIYIICLFVILIPNVSFYYRAVVLLIPFFFYLKSKSENGFNHMDFVCGLFWGLTFSPLFYWFIPNTAIGSDIPIMVFVLLSQLLTLYKSAEIDGNRHKHSF